MSSYTISRNSPVEKEFLIILKIKDNYIIIVKLTDTTTPTPYIITNTVINYKSFEALWNDLTDLFNGPNGPDNNLKANLDNTPNFIFSEIIKKTITGDLFNRVHNMCKIDTVYYLTNDELNNQAGGKTNIKSYTQTDKKTIVQVRGKDGKLKNVQVVVYAKNGNQYRRKKGSDGKFHYVLIKQ